MAGSGVDVGSLVSGGDWAAVPATLPVVALAFVYHNVIPVISQALEGDVRKIRTAVVAGELPVFNKAAASLSVLSDKRSRVVWWMRIHL